MWSPLLRLSSWANPGSGWGSTPKNAGRAFDRLGRLSQHCSGALGGGDRRLCAFLRGGKHVVPPRHEFGELCHELDGRPRRRPRRGLRDGRGAHCSGGGSSHVRAESQGRAPEEETHGGCASCSADRYAGSHPGSEFPGAAAYQGKPAAGPDSRCRRRPGSSGPTGATCPKAGFSSPGFSSNRGIPGAAQETCRYVGCSSESSLAKEPSCSRGCAGRRPRGPRNRWGRHRGRSSACRSPAGPESSAEHLGHSACRVERPPVRLRGRILVQPLGQRLSSQVEAPEGAALSHRRFLWTSARSGPPPYGAYCKLVRAARKMPRGTQS